LAEDGNSLAACIRLLSSFLSPATPSATFSLPMSPILPHTYTLELASPLDLVPASPAALSGPSSSDLQAALPLFSQATYDGVHHMGKRARVGNQVAESGLQLSRRAISLAPDPTQKITSESLVPCSVAQRS
jgi:hypothetical protein